VQRAAHRGTRGVSRGLAGRCDRRSSIPRAAELIARFRWPWLFSSMVSIFIPVRAIALAHFVYHPSLIGASHARARARLINRGSRIDRCRVIVSLCELVNAFCASGEYRTLNLPAFDKIRISQTRWQRTPLELRRQARRIESTESSTPNIECSRFDIFDGKLETDLIPIHSIHSSMHRREDPNGTEYAQKSAYHEATNCVKSRMKNNRRENVAMCAANKAFPSARRENNLQPAKGRG